MLIQENMDIMDKLKILADSAKYDVACTSSGSDRQNGGDGIGNTINCGICHSFSADGRCISLLKVLFTNECIYDCKYCINRRSNDVVRTAFTPDEICMLTMEFYRRNYIEGLFLSSGIIVSPTHTMQLILDAVQKLRLVHHFNGYIHVKGIPGADASVIEEVGWYVDRMSVNLELPTAEGLRQIAPNKTRKNILTPMRQIQTGIKRNKLILADYHSMQHERNAKPVNTYLHEESLIYGAPETGTSLSRHITDSEIILGDNQLSNSHTKITTSSLHDSESRIHAGAKSYVPAGQSTQMIIGATPENDYQIVTVAEALYHQYELKRVFYSAFVNVNEDSTLPSTENGPPLLREHRLYQADWLLRFYGFKSGELLSEKHPYFNTLIDPKADWALQNLDKFPIEINTASKADLLRIPGVGPTSVQRILRARRSAKLDFADIKRMGVVMKRAQYFITCNGKMAFSFAFNEDFITSQLVDVDKRKVYELTDHNLYRQLSLFDVGQSYAALS